MEGLAAAAFAAGLLGGVHCVGMCGGFAAALTAASKGPALRRQLAFNAGRVTSYAAAGALAGGLGSLAAVALPLAAAQGALLVFASVMTMFLGLYVAGWGGAILHFERAGVALWRRIEPLRRRMVPIDTDARAFGAGAVWGWLPCGLVYGMLALALASGGPLEGAAVLAAFGAGTLPSLLGAGLAAQKLLAFRRRPWVRRAAGLAIVAMAVAALGRVPAVHEILAAGWACVR